MKREPDNKSPKGSPGRLHLLAKTVLEGWERKPDPWHREFSEWRDSILGERPREEMGKRGFENWNLVSLGMLLAWGYFAAELQEAAEQEEAEDAAKKEQLALPFAEDYPKVQRPQYAVLGPDGQPIVEGYK